MFSVNTSLSVTVLLPRALLINTPQIQYQERTSSKSWVSFPLHPNLASQGIQSYPRQQIKCSRHRHSILCMQGWTVRSLDPTWQKRKERPKWVKRFVQCQQEPCGVSPEWETTEELSPPWLVINLITTHLNVLGFRCEQAAKMKDGSHGRFPFLEEFPRWTRFVGSDPG